MRGKMIKKCAIYLSYDGYVFVIPEYKSSYPASIKNAVDYLLKEWNEKAALIISYSFSRSGKSAKHFRRVLESVKLKLTAITQSLTLTKQIFNQNGQIKNMDKTFFAYTDTIKKAIQQ